MGMNALEFVKELMVLALIVGLVVAGFAITLQSGVAHLASHEGLRRMAWNLSEALLLLVGCLVGFLIIQQLCRVPVGLLG
jgi:hypothetical protein